MIDPLSAWSHLWKSGQYVLYNRNAELDEDPVKAAAIYNAVTHVVEVFENDVVWDQIKRRMNNEGVPIVSTKPSGENFYQMCIRELSVLGPGTNEFAKAYDEIRDLKLAGKSLDEIKKRIEELRNGK